MLYKKHDDIYLLTFEEVGMGDRGSFGLHEIDFENAPFYVFLREKGFRLEKRTRGSTRDIYDGDELVGDVSIGLSIKCKDNRLEKVVREYIAQQTASAVDSSTSEQSD